MKRLPPKAPVAFRALEAPEEQRVFKVGLRVGADVLSAWASRLAIAPADQLDHVPSLRNLTLVELLASMYLNGVRDCAEVAAKRGLLNGRAG